MKRQLTRLLTALLAVILLLPVTAQAAPAWGGWTAELEAAYQTVSGLVADSVSESRDYLSAARQETNAKAVYALWVSGADVPEGFYNEYLQALADWLALAEQRGRYAYIPGALRTVAAMGLDVTDLAGHDLLEPLRRPEMVEADEDRLDIQEIQREAALNTFDILLVFMFDRLGRRDDETPFIVEWFVNNGIEVWSAEEGQQRFDNHVDKLLNYIRYWQASGESIKTSIRTKTRLGQIVMEGRFRGGYAPYGYQLVKKGRMGKKNRELFDIEVNPMEAAAVRRIFELADQYGYGGRKTSTTLKEEGFINLRTGEPFHYSTIQNILINIAYTGVLRSGESVSEIFPELQIITPEQFQRVQKGREQRSADYLAKCAAAYGTGTVTLKDGSEAEVSRPIRSYPRKNIGSALLSGNVYCGHCGGRIFASTARKTHHPTDGSNGRVAIYKCYNRTQHKENCDGPTTYRAEKVDAVVSKLIRDIFQKAGTVSEYDIVHNQIGATASDLQQQIRQAKLELSKKHIEQGRWEGLMLDSLDGKCPFTPEQVKSRLDSVKEAMTSLSANIESLEARLADSDRLTQELKDQHQQLLSWAEMFDTASPAERKLIASHLIKAVTLTRGYGIQIDFNISEAQYLNGMGV